jgi:hypothetical protein
MELAHAPLDAAQQAQPKAALQLLKLLEPFKPLVFKWFIYAMLRLSFVCNTVLRQPLEALEVDTPYHVLAYVYLPSNTKCVLGADNFQCPYAWITSDGKP